MKPARRPAWEISMNAAQTLRQATVQDIQLELIRRTTFNTFDGERVCEILKRHRNLWRAVLFDRPGVPNYDEPGHLFGGRIDQAP
jgi:hypothetical protein